MPVLVIEHLLDGKLGVRNVRNTKAKVICSSKLDGNLVSTLPTIWWRR